MHKACIFDLDGTLTDTLESLTYSVNKTLDEMELPHITSDQCRTFVGEGAKRLLERALNACGESSEKRIPEAMERYRRIFGTYCTYHVTPYEGIPELLKELKDRQILCAVLSNKPHDQTVDVVEEIFGKGLFSVIQGQCDEIPRKPDPAGIRHILSKLSLSEEECVYVGDSEVDMKTGEAAGVKTVGVEWGFRSGEVLKEAGALNIIASPLELLKYM